MMMLEDDVCLTVKASLIAQKNWRKDFNVSGNLRRVRVKNSDHKSDLSRKLCVLFVNVK